MSRAETLRIGIVGLGFGASVQLPVFQSLPGVAVGAVLALHRSRTDEVAALSGARPCGSLDELLDAELDAVALALPPRANEAALAAVLDTGLAVLSEKPLGVDLATVARLTERAAGRVAGVDFEIAELDCFRELRRAVATGELGPVVEAKIVWQARSRAWASQSWCWKIDAAAGGGVLGLYGAHLFQLIEHALGPIATLTADLRNTRGAAFAPPGRDAAADRARLDLGLAGSIPVAVDLDLAAEEPCFRWVVGFAEHRVVIENRTPGNLTGCRLSLRDGNDVERASSGESEQAAEGRLPLFRRLAGRFVAAVRGDGAMTPDFSAGLRVQRLIAAAEMSAAERRTVDVAPDRTAR